MSSLQEVLDNLPSQLLKGCLVCGGSGHKNDSHYVAVGKQSTSELSKQAANWIEDYIGVVVVVQAVICRDCLGELEEIDEAVRELRETCRQTIEGLSAAEDHLSDHNYTAGPDKILDVPNSKETSSESQCLVRNVEKEEKNKVPLPVFSSQHTVDIHETSNLAEKGEEENLHYDTQTDLCESVNETDSLETVHDPMVNQGSKKTAKIAPVLLVKHAGKRFLSLSKQTSIPRNVKREKNILPKPGTLQPVQMGNPQIQEITEPATQKTSRRKRRKTTSKQPAKTFWCKICNIEFKSSMKCSEHCQSHDNVYCEALVGHASVKPHGMTTRQGDSTDSSVPFQCKICGEEFTNKNDVCTHMRKVHTQQLPYRCKLCDKKLGSKASMRLHLLLHSADKAYKCKDCNKTFAHRYSYNRHIRIHSFHSKSKDNLCQVCGKLYTTADSLRRHVEVTHAKTVKKDHVCDVCGKRFDRQSKLDLHKSSHTDNRDHLCDSCGKTFKSRSGLNSHRKASCPGNDSAKDKEKTSGKTPSHCCTACTRKFNTISKLADHVTVVHEQQCIMCGVPIMSYKGLFAHKAFCEKQVSVSKTSSNTSVDVANGALVTSEDITTNATDLGKTSVNSLLLNLAAGGGDNSMRDKSTAETPSIAQQPTDGIAGSNTSTINPVQAVKGTPLTTQNVASNSVNLSPVGPVLGLQPTVLESLGTPTLPDTGLMQSYITAPDIGGDIVVLTGSDPSAVDINV